MYTKVQRSLEPLYSYIKWVAVTLSNKSVIFLPREMTGALNPPLITAYCWRTAKDPPWDPGLSVCMLCTARRSSHLIWGIHKLQYEIQIPVHFICIKLKCLKWTLLKANCSFSNLVQEPQYSYKAFITSQLHFTLLHVSPINDIFERRYLLLNLFLKNIKLAWSHLVLGWQTWSIPCGIPSHTEPTACINPWLHLSH